MAVPALQPDPHEIRIKRRQRALERTAERGNCRASGLDHRGPLGRIGEPGADADRELAHLGNLLGATRGVEGRIDFRKIPYMRPMEDGGADLDRLDWILAPMTR